MPSLWLRDLDDFLKVPAYSLEFISALMLLLIRTMTVQRTKTTPIKTDADWPPDVNRVA